MKYKYTTKHSIIKEDIILSRAIHIHSLMSYDDMLFTRSENESIKERKEITGATCFFNIAFVNGVSIMIEGIDIKTLKKDRNNILKLIKKNDKEFFKAKRKGWKRWN